MEINGIEIESRREKWLLKDETNDESVDCSQVCFFKRSFFIKGLFRDSELISSCPIPSKGRPNSKLTLKNFDLFVLNMYATPPTVMISKRIRENGETRRNIDFCEKIVNY